MKPKCYKCEYRGRVPGDAHSCCRYPGNETDMFDMFSKKNVDNAFKLDIKADPRGIKGGWFIWPVNFDPVWLLNCNGFKEIKKK